MSVLLSKSKVKGFSQTGYFDNAIRYNVLILLITSKNCKQKKEEIVSVDFIELK